MPRLCRVLQRPARRELLDSPEVQKQHRQIAEEHKGGYLHITCGLLAEDCTGLRGWYFHYVYTSKSKCEKFSGVFIGL